MAISVLQETGNNANSANAVSKAFTSDVTTGSLLVIVGLKFDGSGAAWSSGDCTKSAGTATLGAIAFDQSVNMTTGGAYAEAAVWSAIVTGGGSCTMQVGGASSGSYLLIGMGEYGGSWDGTRLEAANNNSAAPATTTTNADSNSATTAGAGLFIAGAQFTTTSAATIADDGSFVSIYKNETGTDDNGSIIRRIVGAGTTDTANWTVTGTTTNGWAAVIAAYKEVGGGPTYPLMGQACL